MLAQRLRPSPATFSLPRHPGFFETLMWALQRINRPAGILWPPLPDYSDQSVVANDRVGVSRYAFKKGLTVNFFSVVVIFTTPSKPLPENGPAFCQLPALDSSANVQKRAATSP